MLYLLIIGVNSAAVATMQKQYKDGTEFGNGATTLGDPAVVGSDLLQNNKDFSRVAPQNDTLLSEAGATAMRQSDVGAVVTESNAKLINAREEHQINPKNGFFQQSLAIEKDPLKVTGGREMVARASVSKESKESCEEGVKFTIDVIRQLVYVPPPRQIMNTEITINYPAYLTKVGRRNDEMAVMKVYDTNRQIDIQRFKQYGCPHFQPVDAVSGQRFTIDCNRIQNFFMVSVPTRARTWVTDCFGERWNAVNLIRVSYKHDTYQSEGENRDSWTVITPEQEAIVEKNNCYEINRICLDTGDKKFDELTVKRPCWKEQVTYSCESEPQDGCKHLKEKSCTLSNSICVQTVGPLCLKWQHNYTCTLREELISPGLENAELFCLDGNCYTPEADKNTDLNQAIAHLAIFSEMQKDMIHSQPPTVFSGNCRGCNKHMLSFKDCCSSMKGWGASLGLTSCSEEERALAKMRDAGLCHYVGTYCAEKVPLTGFCLRKKSNYCCFQSKLSRIFHEGGRGQIGLSWGSAENPDCRAFTVDELQRIDFSKINLSELFHDLFKSIGEKVQKLVPRQMQDQMPNIQKNIDGVKQFNRDHWNEDGVQKTVF